jgi:Mg-chelatase subunit ChlD
MFPTCLVWCRRAAALAALAAAAAPARAADAPPAAKKPQVEVVFCLDTTGSMGGLIEGAKQKIWAISNQIANGKPTPQLKVGLVAYRDKGDAYITKVFDLTDDLDAVHATLKGFRAEGGGDEPESVNQALDDAVHKVKWSTDKATLRIIFLVGDAPPHMDYPDDVKYPETCKKAVTKGIIINTVQCGGSAECQRFWKDICAKAEGSYVQIPQDGGVTLVATPYDRRLAEINGELAQSTLVYGSSDAKAEGTRKLAGAGGLAPAAAAERVAFQAKNRQVAAYDLLDNVKQGKVKLEDIKKADLPDEMQKMTPAEQKAYLEKLDKRRSELGKEAVELDKKRADYIAKKQAEEAGKGGFDKQVLDVLRQQAKRYQIAY